MKRTIPDQAADARLERLLDEELHAVLDAPAVDLRDKVLRAIDEGRATREAGGWALALATAAILVFAVVTIWQGSVRTPERSTANRPPLASAPLFSAAVIRPVAESAAGERRVTTAAKQRSPTPFAWDLKPVAADASANEPYLPGAPAGELGDPLRPLPSPPPISFAPIASASPVSEFARPVTDFPTDNPAPAQSSGEAGRSGGTRR